MPWVRVGKMRSSVDTFTDSEPSSALAAGERDLARFLVEAIGEAIIRGELPLGSKISEPALARRYNVSRSPLREALNRLAERRLIERTPSLGARVVSLSTEALHHIYAVREPLEGLAAREAATRATEDDIAALRATLARHENEVRLTPGGAPNAMGGADNDFHAMLARISGNDLLVRLLCDDLYQQLRLYRSQLRHVPGRGLRAAVEHRRVLEAIEDRDPELAEMMMRRHVAASRAAVVPGVEKDHA